MKVSLQELQKILQPFIDAEEEETGDHPDTEEILRNVIEWKVDFEHELKDFYKERDFSAQVLIQHILRRSGDEIIQ